MSIFLSVTWLWWSFECSAGFLLRLDICARSKKYTFPPSDGERPVPAVPPDRHEARPVLDSRQADPRFRVSLPRRLLRPAAHVDRADVSPAAAAAGQDLGPRVVAASAFVGRHGHGWGFALKRGEGGDKYRGAEDEGSEPGDRV